MPTSAVYQPTTVNFENTSGPIFPHQTSTSSRLKAAFRKPWMKIILLVGALFFLTLGLILISTSFADYEDAEQNKEFVTEIPVHEEELDVALMILGAFFTIFGISLMGIYIKVIDWRRSCVVCPCSYRKKQLVRQLQGNSGGGQIMALNHPSTDPLVSTQYAPISEIPRYEDEEEGKKHMLDGNAAEESHLLTEPSDPRIVLKPSSTQD